jgi:hypothetical protein
LQDLVLPEQMVQMARQGQTEVPEEKEFQDVKAVADSAVHAQDRLPE